MLREVVSNDWYVVFCLASLVIVLVAKTIHPFRFLEFLKLFWNTNYLRIYLKEHAFFDNFDATASQLECHGIRYILPRAQNYSYHSFTRASEKPLTGSKIHVSRLCAPAPGLARMHADPGHSSLAVRIENDT